MKKYMPCLLALVLLTANVAHAQIPQAKGSATARLPRSPEPDPKAKRGRPPTVVPATELAAVRSEAVELAKINAMDRYVAEQEPGLAPLYDSLRLSIVRGIDAYLLGSVVLEEFQNAPGELTVVVRVDIDRSRLDAKLKAGVAANTARSEMRTLTFVFVAREQESVTQYDNSTVRRVATAAAATDTASTTSAATIEADVRTAGQAKAERTNDASQGERIARGSVKLSDHEKQSERSETRAKLAGSTTTSADTSSAAAGTSEVASTSSGSSSTHADDIKWRVSQAVEINQTLTGLFADVGYEVVEAEYLEPESNGLISIENIRKDFGSGDDMKPATLRNTAKGALAAGVPFLVYGTLDVGLRDTDATSGLPRVMVTVSAKAIDVRGRFPRTVAAVGPIQFSGTGPNGTGAKSNALKLAALEAGKQLMTQLNSRPAGN